jgi:hypothetical protein
MEWQAFKRLVHIWILSVWHWFRTSHRQSGIPNVTHIHSVKQIEMAVLFACSLKGSSTFPLPRIRAVDQTPSAIHLSKCGVYDLGTEAPCNYTYFQVIIFSMISSIAGRLAASFIQHRLINFQALSLKGGLSSRGGRLPRETCFTIWISFIPWRGIVSKWICTILRSVQGLIRLERERGLSS